MASMARFAFTRVASGRSGTAITAQLSSRSCDSSRLPSKPCERGRQASKSSGNLIAPLRSVSKGSFATLSPTASRFGSKLSFGSCHSSFSQMSHGLLTTSIPRQYGVQDLVALAAEDGVDFDEDEAGTKSNPLWRIRRDFDDEEGGTKSIPLRRACLDVNDEGDGTKSNPLRRSRRVAFADEPCEDSTAHAATEVCLRSSVMLLGRVCLDKPLGAVSLENPQAPPEAVPVDERILAQAARAAALRRRCSRLVGSGASFVP